VSAATVWWMGFWLNAIVTFFTGSLLAAVVMVVCIGGFAYSDKMEN
jgi:hypothetical protein